jgi:hypothetical protein
MPHTHSRRIHQRSMTPFARYLLDQRWKILFTAQGIFMASLYYARFAANPVGPLKALKPNVDLKVDDAHAVPITRQK